jgi:hypothetical protein
MAVEKKTKHADIITRELSTAAKDSFGWMTMGELREFVRRCDEESVPDGTYPLVHNLSKYRTIFNDADYWFGRITVRVNVVGVDE